FIVPVQAHAGARPPFGIPGVIIRVVIKRVQPIGAARVSGDSLDSIANYLRTPRDRVPNPDRLQHIPFIGGVGIAVNDARTVERVNVQGWGIGVDRVALIKVAYSIRLRLEMLMSQTLGHSNCEHVDVTTLGM